jgi:hypothetical protein
MARPPNINFSVDHMFTTLLALFKNDPVARVVNKLMSSIYTKLDYEVID